MSFVGDFVSDLFGGGADAAEKAAKIQSKSAKKAISSQEQMLETVRSDLQPFREAGVEVLPGTKELITDPEKQREFIQSNAFYNALADDAEQRLLSNQAAWGKLGSGDTAKALQNSLVLLGNDLLNQNINQRFNLATLGSNAAAGQATLTQNTGNNIANLITGRGNALAAGEVGAANARGDALSQLASAAGLILSDIRMKENIKRVGQLDDGYPVYAFNYRGDDTVHLGIMAQDVEQVSPENVVELEGVKFVDYRSLFYG